MVTTPTVWDGENDSISKEVSNGGSDRNYFDEE